MEQVFDTLLNCKYDMCTCSYFSEDDILKELEELSLEAQGGRVEKEPPAIKVNVIE